MRGHLAAACVCVRPHHAPSTPQRPTAPPTRPTAPPPGPRGPLCPQAQRAGPASRSGGPRLALETAGQRHPGLHEGPPRGTWHREAEGQPAGRGKGVAGARRGAKGRRSLTLAGPSVCPLALLRAGGTPEWRNITKHSATGSPAPPCPAASALGQQQGPSSEDPSQELARSPQECSTGPALWGPNPHPAALRTP